MEDPYPLQTPKKCNNPRQASGRIPAVTQQRAATPPGRGRVGTVGRSSPSPTPRGSVPTDAALQATRSSSQLAPRILGRARGRPRDGGTVVGGRPPRRSRLPKPPTWPGEAGRAGVPGSRTGGQRSRGPRTAGEPTGSRRTPASGGRAANRGPRVDLPPPGAAGTSAKVLGLCGVTVSLRNLPPAPNKTRRGGAGG